MQNRILVVDDDRNYLGVMQDSLTDAGFAVETCPESVKAMELLSANPAQCVLMDYHMPGMDGEDLLRMIHSRYPKLPVIICTGQAEIHETEFMREGAYEVLHKPFDHSALIDLIHRALITEEDKTSITIEGFDLRKAREMLSRKLIIKALTKCNFNVTQAASLLGISRQYLIRNMKDHRITR